MRYAMDVLRDVLKEFLRDTMKLIVGEGDRATDENQVAEATEVGGGYYVYARVLVKVRKMR